MAELDANTSVLGDGEAMSDADLAALCTQFEQQAVGEEWDEIAKEQERAINYYYRRMPDLPAEEGTSSVTADTVQVTVDDAMAEVLKPFVSSDDFAVFEPTGPEDEEIAEQATDYVNYVLSVDNGGFLLFHNWFKDAFLTKLGVVKVWWEDQTRVIPQQAILDPLELLAARESQEYGGEEDNGDGTYTVTLNVVEPDGKCCIETVPSEEFKISPYARTIDDATYVCHAPKDMTRSDLVEMGYDRDIVEALPAWTATEAETSREQARYQDERYGGTDRQLGTPHKSQERIAFREEYIRVDYDGDGIAELRKIHRVGDTILLNEEIDESPFATLCPIPMPHKVYGQSLADQTTDLQRIETVLWRQMLDNLYKSNNPRPVIGQGALLDDGSTADSLLDNAPGAAVLVKQASEFSFEAVPFTADKSYGMLDYVQQKRAQRTGFHPTGNGLDRDALNTSKVMTATQAGQVEDKANARAEMIARIFAETGVKRLMRLILRTLIQYQPKARVIRLRNQWVEMDPSGWNPEMDVTINVGLGMGNKQEQIARSQAVLELQERLAMSPYASLVAPENVYKAARGLVTAAGYKDADEFITEPSGEPQQEQPSPELVKVQQEGELQAAKLQGEQAMQAAKLQGEQAAQAAKLEAMREEMLLKQQLAREEAEFEAQLAREKFAQEIQIAREKMAMEAELARERAQIDADTKVAVSKNRPGGDLDK
jgi:hypothetical protein